MPYFVLGFIAAMLTNTMIAIPEAPKSDLVATTNYLLALAGAASWPKCGHRGWATLLALGSRLWLTVWEIVPGLMALAFTTRADRRAIS